MPVSSNFLEFVLDQLSSLGSVRARRMFGGIGLYAGELFFGVIDDDIVYFKVDDSNRSNYTSRGCEAFRPLGDDTVSMSYFRVPEDVLEESDELKSWANKALRVATAAATAKSLRTKKSAARKRSGHKSKTSRKR